jgi:succinoglycan biosynthesis protein ExoA
VEPNLSEKKTRISIIVPVRSGPQPPACSSSIENSKYPLEKVEVIVIAGNNPSAQRNLGASKARGEILYFLDDDSMLHPRALQTLDEAFEDHPQFAGIGGPSVGAPSGSLFQKCAAMAMGSLFGMGPARHRYYPSGCPRPGGDNELILSNFAIRRSVWTDNSGFDTRLYPNEENEFMGRLESAGYRFLYHPGIWVFRPARQTLGQMLLQIFSYGRSRSQHIRIASRPVNTLMGLPSLFVIYLVAINALAVSIELPWAAQLPGLAYAVLMVGASAYASLSVRSRRVGTFFWHLVVFPSIHLSYGCGMIGGFLFPKLGSCTANGFTVLEWKQSVQQPL